MDEGRRPSLSLAGLMLLVAFDGVAMYLLTIYDRKLMRSATILGMVALPLMNILIFASPPIARKQAKSWRELPFRAGFSGTGAAILLLLLVGVSINGRLIFDAIWAVLGLCLGRSHWLLVPGRPYLNDLVSVVLLSLILGLASLGGYLTRRMASGRLARIPILLTARAMGHEMANMTVGLHGEITLPDELRERYGLTPESPVRIIETRAGVLILPNHDGPMREELARELADRPDF